MTFKATQNDFAFIGQREACAFTAYWDGKPPPEGDAKPALGYGVNDPSAIVGETTIDFAECNRRFVAKMRDYEEEVDRLFPGPFIWHQKSAFLSILYNVGGTWLRNEEPEFLEATRDLASDPTNRIKQDDVAALIPRLKYRPHLLDEGKTPFHNLSRKMSEGALFLRGDYGDISYVKVWTERKTPGIDPYLRVQMPKFI